MPDKIISSSNSDSCPRPLRAILEAFFWTSSYSFAQLLTLCTFLLLLFIARFGWSRPETSELVEFVDGLQLDKSILLIAVTTLGSLCVMIPAMIWRLGRGYRRQLGLDLPRHEEVIYALATVVPIVLLGDVLYALTRDWFSAAIFQKQLQALLDSDSIGLLTDKIDGVPLPMLIVAMALGPAIGEELLFRGLIGRLLVDHLGVWRGSCLTVLLFAFAHISPAHAIATIPIGCLLQFLYLKTGRIWIPILIHFLNNLLGVMMLRYEFTPPFVTPLTVAVIFCYLLAILAVFHVRQRSWGHALAP